MMHGMMKLKEKAKKTLGKAIKLHEVHIDKPKTATEKSQNKLMELMDEAYEDLERNSMSKSRKGK